MSDQRAPRVNQQLLERFINTNVRLVGKVNQVQPNYVRLQASDKREVTVHTANPSVFVDGHVVEVWGMVNGDRTVSEASTIQFGPDFGSY